MTMTFVKTWQCDPNRVPLQGSVLEQGQYNTWYLKAFLKGEIGGASSGLWTCVGSCDSVSVVASGTTAATDLWGSSFAASKIIRGQGAAIRSWIVLKSPAGLGPYYMCISRDGAGDYNVTTTYSKNPFTLTTGSTTARPTSTTEFDGADVQYVEQSLTTGHISGVLATDGTFYVMWANNGSSQWHGLRGFFELGSTKAADTHKCWAITSYSNVTGGAWRSGNLSLPTGCTGRNYNNTVSVTGSIVELNAAGAMLGGQLVASDPTDGLATTIWPWLYCNTFGHKSLRGRVVDIGQGPTSLANGSQEPATGSPTSVICAGTWFPFNAIPSL